MKTKVNEVKENPLFKRKEVYFTVEHVGESTPGRNAVAEEIAKQCNTKRNCVVVDNLKSNYGIGITEGYAKVYDNKDAALEFENGYLLKRNGIAKEEAPAEPAQE